MPQKYNTQGNCILGIQIGHDSSCCLVKEGKIIFAEEEERKNGIKNYAGIPWNSIYYALKKYNVQLEQIKHVAIPWDYSDYIFSRQDIIKESFEQGNLEYGNRKQTILNNFKQYIKEIQLKFSYSKIIFVPHHISHLYSTLPFHAKIQFENTSAIISDAIGEYSSCSIYGSIEQLNLIQKQDLNESIGYFYQRFAEFVGFRGRQAPGYFMSLASLGNPNIFKRKLEQYFIKASNGIKKINSVNFHPLKGNGPTAYKCFSEEFLNDINYKHNLEVDIKQKDLCASVQLLIEDIVLSWCKYIKKEVATKNIVLSGGVFLNCKLNQRIKESGLFEKVYLGPAVKDSGTSMGAALFTLTNENKNNILCQDISAYLGTQISGKEEVFNLIPTKYINFSNFLISDIVNDLIHGKVVALSAERLEFGPRALGARSIIALPRNKNISKRINRTIKRRYDFQPFAASMSSEAASEYFGCTEDEEFMTTTYTAKKTKQIEEIIHEDLSCRLHVVKPSKTPNIYLLIFEELKKRELPQVILNTSFNGRGKPLPSDAFTALIYYLNLDIDILYTPISRIEVSFKDKYSLLTKIKATKNSSKTLITN